MWAPAAPVRRCSSGHGAIGGRNWKRRRCFNFPVLENSTIRTPHTDIGYMKGTSILTTPRSTGGHYEKARLRIDRGRNEVYKPFLQD
jgi:hypothetical protein